MPVSAGYIVEGNTNPYSEMCAGEPYNPNRKLTRIPSPYVRGNTHHYDTGIFAVSQRHKSQLSIRLNRLTGTRLNLLSIPTLPAVYVATLLRSADT